MGYPYPNPPPPPPPPPPRYPSGYPSSPYSQRRQPYQYGKPISVSAEALVYLFPEYFAKRVRIGGFKAPYANVKVSHKSLYKALITVPIAYMEYMRVADLRIVRVGKIFKHDEAVLVKLANFDPADYGLVSGELSTVPIGHSVNLERSIYLVFMGDYSEPEKEYIKYVYRYRVKGNIRIDSQWDLARYRREAETLYGIWMNQRGIKPRAYSVAEKDAEKAANARRTGPEY